MFNDPLLRAPGVPPRVAVVGSGIAGLAAARRLAPHAQVTLFEAAAQPGGHARTVDVTLDGITHGVDTGFLVFNDRTYPGLRRLFAELAVPVAASDMSFSVQVPRADGRTLEWSGTNLQGVFCQPSNLARPAFWRMLRDLLRFNALATQIAESGADRGMQQPLGLFLDLHGFGHEFRDWYLLPMTACIWSCPTDTMLRFPAGTLIRFCHNHGLLTLSQRPQWYTVAGGSRVYVERIVRELHDVRLGTPVREVRRSGAGVAVATDAGTERFDHVVLASHPGQSLALLADASRAEREVLGAIRYQPNRAVLHTDASLLPRSRRAWSAWNYASGEPGSARVCLHYLINRLQPLPWAQPVIVSLNPLREPDAATVLDEHAFEHPVFDRQALAAQDRLAALQGERGTWFCGAWTGYGFHEDGLRAGEIAAAGVLARLAEPQRAAA